MIKTEDKDKIRADFEGALNSGVGSSVARYALSVLGGLIPIVGGGISGLAGAWSDKDSQQFKRILAAWLKLQEDEIKEIGRTLFEVMERLNLNDEDVQKRLESSEYLQLVKKCFREWSAAESEEKRRLIRNLLTNAASTRMTDDDVIRLFIE